MGGSISKRRTVKIHELSQSDYSSGSSELGAGYSSRIDVDYLHEEMLNVKTLNELLEEELKQRKEVYAKDLTVMTQKHDDVLAQLRTDHDSVLAQLRTDHDSVLAQLAFANKQLKSANQKIQQQDEKLSQCVKNAELCEKRANQYIAERDACVEKCKEILYTGRGDTADAIMRSPLHLDYMDDATERRHICNILETAHDMLNLRPINNFELFEL